MGINHCQQTGRKVGPPTAQQLQLSCKGEPGLVSSPEHLGTTGHPHHKAISSRPKGTADLPNTKVETQKHRQSEDTEHYVPNKRTR